MKPEYTYRATVTNVVDGDTIDALVDLGFDIQTKIRFRLYGIDTPEKTDKVELIRILAQTASKFVSDNILNKEVLLKTYSKDKFGRWLAKVISGDNQPTINEQLVSLGYAKAYFGDNKGNLHWDN